MSRKLKEEVKKRFELFEQGLSIKEVSDLTGETYKTVEASARRYRKSGGIVNKLQRNFANHTYFDVIDTETKAYLLGFFLADGSIDGSKHRNGEFSKRLGVQNSIDDLDIIKLFHSEICPKSNIRHSNNQGGVKYRKPQVSIRWSSDHMTTTLINKYNFCRLKAYNKEFYFPFNNIPKKLYRHFIRGFFDGDGTVDFAKTLTKNGVETSRFQYGFICNSLPFTEQLSKIISNLCKGVSGSISHIDGKTTDWFMLRFNTHRINPVEKRYIFYKYLYKNANIYLQRKKNKFDAFFEYRGKPLV